MSQRFFYRACCLLLVAQGVLAIIAAGRIWLPSHIGVVAHTLFVGTHVLLVVAAGLCYVMPRRGLVAVITTGGAAWMAYLWVSLGSGAAPPWGELVLRVILTSTAVVGMERFSRYLVPAEAQSKSARKGAA